MTKSLPASIAAVQQPQASRRLESPPDAKGLFGPGAFRCSAGPLKSVNISGLSAEMAYDSIYSNSMAKIDHCSRPLSKRTMRPPRSGHGVRP